MTTLFESGDAIREITKKTHSELVGLLRSAEQEAISVKVPNTIRARTLTKAKGLRLSEEIDQRLEVLTNIAKAGGSLMAFEKPADLIRHLINEEYLRVVGALYGRK
jgi:hypothetical protein